MYNNKNTSSNSIAIHHMRFERNLKPFDLLRFHRVISKRYFIISYEYACVCIKEHDFSEFHSTFNKMNDKCTGYLINI